MGSRFNDAQFFFELCSTKNKQFDELCKQKFKHIFSGGIPINGEPTTTVIGKINDKRDEDLQLFIRRATNGSVIERDRLLEYSCYGFYNELNLFVLENNKDAKGNLRNSV